MPASASRLLASATIIAILASCGRSEKIPVASAPAGPSSPARGKQLLTQYGCISCHRIPTVEGAKGKIGPALDHIGSHPMLSNKFPNDLATLTRWLQNPQSMDPDSSMPDLDVTPADARDISAFLLSLK